MPQLYPATTNVQKLVYKAEAMGKARGKCSFQIEFVSPTAFPNFLEIFSIIFPFFFQKKTF